MEITAEQRKELKGMGFLSNKDKEHFSARVITENGVLTAAQIVNIGEAAQKFGNGNVSFTSRMTVEVPGIKPENAKAFQEYVAKEGMVTGGTGPRVRPIVACKGTVCVFGNIDTQGLATELHKRFYEGYYDVVLPHKFKIAVGGCPNSCVKPTLNDLGIVGTRVPKSEDGQPRYQVFVGGRWGREQRAGDKLDKLFTKDELMDMVEKVILLFKDNANKGERFASMIERMGFEQVQKMLLG